jgi:hypothetical protein
MAVILLPSSMVKRNTTRGWPPATQTRPAAPSMRAGSGAQARPAKTRVTASALRISAATPIWTAA